MARVNVVEKAAKDYPDQGIKKGEPYFWWKFRHGGKIMSKTRPRPSQLTQSEFLSTVYAALEVVEDLTVSMGREDLSADIRQAAEDIRAAGEEQADKVSNMPDSLQQSPTAEMMEQRASDTDDLAGQLEGFADQLDDEDITDEEIQSVLEEAQALSYDGE